MKTIDIFDGGKLSSKVFFTPWEEFLNENINLNNVVVITDNKLFSKYGKQLNKYRSILIPCGENIKTLKTIEYIISKLVEMECDRGVTIIGFGGGVVTDITGFVASIYMRGVEFAFVPTTLLGQVDASIGGKNGVNFNGFKNMIGAFNHPKFVVCDVNVVYSLPDSEFISGMAEIIKTAFILDKELVNTLNSMDLDEIKSDKNLLESVIFKCVELKANIVELDLKESGLRRKLNFGHTFGHAIEKTTNKYTHGEAISMGMIFASNISMRKGFIDKSDFDLICSVLTKYKLPIEYKDDFTWVVNNIIHDKKRTGDHINMALLFGIGDCLIEKINLIELKQR